MKPEFMVLNDIWSYYDSTIAYFSGVIKMWGFLSQ